MLTSERKKPKRSKIRYAEYYDLQKILDSLYADSLKGKVFVHLMELISSEENIRMAYRTIKAHHTRPCQIERGKICGADSKAV